MLLLLHVLCFKIDFFLLFLSLQIFCEISHVYSPDSGGKSVGVWCAVFVKSATYYRSKTVQFRIFFVHVSVVSHILKIL